MIKIIKSKVQPNPAECKYWIDESADVYSGIIKYFNGTGWVALEGGSEDLDQVMQLLNNKVDKVSGKQLSTNDYTTDEKNKLAGLNNTVVVNNLTTTTTTSALSAAQGKVLKDALDALSARVSALESPAA